MAAWSRRHYGTAAYKLTDPKVIVEHGIDRAGIGAVYDTFAHDRRDPELHESQRLRALRDRPRRDDRAVRRTALRCRHTVGLNWTSYGIEHVGRNDREILANRRQVAASLRLTAWLRCRHGIAVKNVIGHNENRTSPFHHESVTRLQTQTYPDLAKASMDVYRVEVRRRPRCAVPIHSADSVRWRGRRSRRRWRRPR